MDEVAIFFVNFQILGPLGCQGWVVMPQNVKKANITGPYFICWDGRREGEPVRRLEGHIAGHRY
jgi:hypothetical protein